MLTITDQIWNELNTVNDAVNALPYKTNMELYNKVDFWTFITERGGDCADYVLEKRRRLAALGIDIHELRICVCYDELKEAHAVLTIDTDRGTYVLDNRQTSIMTWDQLTQLGYSWLERQSPIGDFWDSLTNSQR